MAAKQYFIIVDTETTITDKVVDFGAIVVDRKGIVVAQCAIMVQSVFGVDKLFYNKDAAGIWAAASIDRRMGNYNSMLEAGTRMLASVNAINRWLEKVNAKYNPTLTAYNLAFDRTKCENTQIDLSIFADRFCLWAAAVGNICNSKQYRQFVAENHLFNKVTEHGNMTFSTTAESVAGYLAGIMSKEPHTAFEDALYYELPILVNILKKKNWKEKTIAYNWKSHQVKDHFTAK